MSGVALITLILSAGHLASCRAVRNSKELTSTLMLTGDVNLFPVLPTNETSNFTFVWGDLLDIARSVDCFAINHESTLAEVPDQSPATIQFQDPLDYQQTYLSDGVGVDFLTSANNHQFDYEISGLETTLEQLSNLGFPFGGIGTSAEAVRAPVVVPVNGQHIAFFSMVVDECWVWPNGSLYLDACTCGSNAGPSPPYQCYSANASMPGLWYHWGIDDEIIEEASTIVGAWKKANPDHLVVTFLHVGPNFQWQPYPGREWLLRNLSVAGADIVWGTSSHHLQRLEFWNNKPIIYGLGDFAFRHYPGVSDFCPLYAVPCEQYRPELALSYVFSIDWASGIPEVSPAIKAYGLRHTPYQSQLVSQSDDALWIEDTFNELSQPYGASIAYAGAGVFAVTQIPPTQTN